MNRAEIDEQIASVKWYHGFEVLPGVMTPGKCIEDLKAIFDYMQIPGDLKGQTVLEIGTFDGPYAFELESRGASVIATDIQNPNKTGFNVAKRLRGSSVQYVRSSVYELSQHVREPVDAVLFKGVLYHLKHPVLAIEEIQKIVKVGGRVYFETECFSHYAETIQGISVRNWLPLALVANSDIPLTLSCPGRYKNAINWFVPNVACLKAWFQESGLNVEWIKTTTGSVTQQPGRKLQYLLDIFRNIYPRRNNWEQRAYGVAVKSGTPPKIEHHVVGEKAAKQAASPAEVPALPGGN